MNIGHLDVASGAKFLHPQDVFTPMQGVQMTGEEWRPIEGWPYEISDRGRVRRGRPSGGSVRGHILQSHIYRGYPRVLLRDQPRKAWFSVHHLVAVAFIGPPPGRIGLGRHDWQVNHKNAVKSDNRVENLEWVTHAENKRHAAALGLMVRGEPHHSSKLTAQQVAEIRARHAAGECGAPTLALEYGVSTTTVTKILQGRKWAFTADADLVEARPRLGFRGGKPQLTEDAVRAIRSRYAQGEHKRALAREYDVSVNTIERVVSRRTWGHVQ